MAVTHADLAPSRSSTELGSKAGTVLIIICILCGLLCFILCLIAEATRSTVTWQKNGEEGKHRTEECIYSGSGQTPLLCAGCAFLGLAAVMVAEHIYMLVAVTKSNPPVLVSWDPDSSSAKALIWQAGFLFISTWVFFAVGEVLLLTGVSVESGHLKNWSAPRPSCLIIPHGLFSAAGVFGLATIFMATGLYLTALRAQKLCHEQESVRRQGLDISVLFASPPLSPRITPLAAQNPTASHNHNRQSPSQQFSSVFTKHSFGQV